MNFISYSTYTFAHTLRYIGISDMMDFKNDVPKISEIILLEDCATSIGLSVLHYFNHVM